MEYVSKINIFGLKLMVKSGLEKIFMKSLHAQEVFYIKIVNSVIKMTSFAQGWIPIYKMFCDVDT